MTSVERAILDDIEFGYDLQMIKGKIEQGSYSESAEPVSNEEIRKAAESRINEAYELLERIEGLDESATSCLDMVKMFVSIAAQETYELYFEL